MFGFVKKKSPHRAISAGESGFGAPFHIAYVEAPLPQGGAQRFVYDTLALPLFTPVGPGCGIKQSFNLSPSSGAIRSVVKSLLPNGLGSPGYLVGAFVTSAPLVEVGPDGSPIEVQAESAEMLPRGFGLAPGSA